MCRSSCFWSADVPYHPAQLSLLVLYRDLCTGRTSIHPETPASVSGLNLCFGPHSFRPRPLFVLSRHTERVTRCLALRLDRGAFCDSLAALRGFFLRFPLVKALPTATRPPSVARYPRRPSVSPTPESTALHLTRNKSSTPPLRRFHRIPRLAAIPTLLGRKLAALSGTTPFRLLAIRFVCFLKLTRRDPGDHAAAPIRSGRFSPRGLGQVTTPTAVERKRAPLCADWSR